MLDLVYRVLPVVLVFLTDVLYSWVWGGTRAEPLLHWMPWAALLSLQVLFFYPQRHPWEDAVMARRRTWKSLARDPLTWMSLIFLVLLLIPLVNRGLCPGCDIVAIRCGENPAPPVSFLPFCVNVKEHSYALMWIVPTLISTLAIRHALVKSGRRMFFEMLVWNGALLAVFGFVLIGMGATEPYAAKIDAMQEWRGRFFSTFGYPNMAGTYFVLMCALSVGVWRFRWTEAGALLENLPSNKAKPRYLWVKANYPIVAAALTFFGALCSLSRSAIISVFILTGLAFIYIFFGIFARERNERIRSVKGLAWACAGMILFVIMVYVFAPEGVSRELNSVTSREVLDRVSSKGTYHARVSMEMFKSHPLFGVGFWGYRHLCREYMTPDEQKSIQLLGGANVHNDYLQFLCEFGGVGALLIIASILSLIMPLVKNWRMLYKSAKFTGATDAPIAALALLSPPAPVFWVFIGAVFVLFHACGDCPLRSGAVVFALFTSLAAAEGFLPDLGPIGIDANDEEGRSDQRRHHHHHHHHRQTEV